MSFTNTTPLVWRAVAAAALLASTQIGVVTPASATLLPDLSISAYGSANPVAAGGALAYTLYVFNPSYDACAVQRPNCEPIPMGSTVRNIVVTDTFPSGVQFDSASADSGFSCTQSGGLVTCSGGTLGRDAVATITINVHAPNAGATLTNTARVDPYGAIPERNEANNSASVVTTVTPPPPPPLPADLTISSFTASPGVQGINQYETYTITVSNIGQGAAVGGLQVNWTAPWVNNVPRDITQVQNVVADNGFACAAPLFDYVNQDVVCWTNNTLNPNTTAHISFSVLGSSTPITATAAVTADWNGAIPESNENNNQATLTTSFV